MYIYIYLYIYRHHSDDRSMPTDQQGLGQPKVGNKMVDQQGAGCRGNPAQSEDGKVKAQLRSTHRLSSMLDRSAWQRWP